MQREFDRALEVMLVKRIARYYSGALSGGRISLLRFSRINKALCILWRDRDPFALAVVRAARGYGTFADDPGHAVPV